MFRITLHPPPFDKKKFLTRTMYGNLLVNVHDNCTLNQRTNLPIILIIHNSKSYDYMEGLIF